MFKTLGKSIRSTVDLLSDSVEAIIEIPGDIVEGYKEGFSDTTKSKTVDDKENNDLKTTKE